MNRYLFSIASIGLGLVLVGAGCNTQQPSSDTSDTMMQEDSSDTMMKDDAAEVTVNVTGENFSFSPNKITVKKGQTVKINFTSKQGFHDWVVDEFDAHTEQINAPNSSSVTFVANKAGEFEFYCSVGQHRQLGMVGTLVVEDDEGGMMPDDSMEKRS